MDRERRNGPSWTRLGILGEQKVPQMIPSDNTHAIPFPPQIPPLSLTAQPEVPAPTTLYTLSLHQAPISSVRSRPLPAVPTTATSAPHLLTAGWDGLIGLWDLTPGVNEGDADLEGADRKKKRRRQSTTVVNKVSLHAIVLLHDSSSDQESYFRRLRWRPCADILAKSRGRCLTGRMSPRLTRRVGITRFGAGTSRLGPRSAAR